MKLNNISKAISVLAIGLAFAACTKTADYVPADPVENKTYVGADINTPREIEADGAAILAPFTRNKVAEALDVNVFLSDPSGIFSLENTTLHFDVGQATAEAEVSYSYDALVPETVYNIAVELASTEYASEYRAVAFPLSVTKAWQKIPAQFYDDWWVGGPMDKVLLKSPDGSETYRLLDPWDKETVTAAGFTYTGGLDYLEFTISEDGAVSWGGKTGIFTTPFKYSGRTTHMMHPSKQKDDAGVAKNKLLMPGLVQFCWYPILNYNASSGSYSWWGTSSFALLSWGDGPDIEDLLN